MTFWDLTPDEREQWRKDKVTAAYIDQLYEHNKDAIGNAISALKSGGVQSAYNWAGVADGLLDAIHVAEDVK